jgi:hypothetical protein
MKSYLCIAVIATLSIFIVSGCTSSPAADQTITNTTVNPTASSEDVIVAAKQDLSQRTGIDYEYINTLYLRVVRWPDTSLGCPEEGMEYAQVITDGYQVLLEANGYVYEYHTDTRGSACLYAIGSEDDVEVPIEPTTTNESSCEEFSEPIITAPIATFPVKDISDGKPWMPVD